MQRGAGGDYSEIIVDGLHLNAHMPDAVEAFYGAGDTARDQHAKFLEEYGLSKEDVPLMLFDPRNWETPFRVRKDIYENPT